MKNLSKIMVTALLIIILVGWVSLSEALFNNLPQGRWEGTSTFVKLGDNHNHFIDGKNGVSRQSFQGDIKPLFTHKYELSLLSMKMQADSKKTKSKQKEFHNLRWQLQEKTADYRPAFRHILTPEQLSKFPALGLARDRYYPRDRGGRGDDCTKTRPLPCY